MGRTFYLMWVEDLRFHHPGDNFAPSMCKMFYSSRERWSSGILAKVKVPIPPFDTFSLDTCQPGEIPFQRAAAAGQTQRG